ncbi:MAG: hypothetical protein DRG78_24460 [Epsilonproteobacteria bacterium]|nr:MAG: hypothetical protein DRG78_24460 [Campylobacterota bacterium]
MKFNSLSHDEKLDVQKLVINCMDTLGGRNYFLGMIEDIKEAKQHPLLNKTSKFHFKHGTISWGKEIYKDKVMAIKNMLIKYSADNILEIKDDKLQKEIKNSIRTLGKLVYTINIKDGNDYTFSSFNTISEDNIEIDTMFQIIFFDSINNTKYILDYK